MAKIQQLSVPTSVVFGAGAFDNVAQLLIGDRCLLVTTRGFVQRGVVERVRELLDARLAAVFDQVTPNPRVEDIDSAASVLQQECIDVILAIGGGSVIDTAKALSVCLGSPNQSLLDHFATGRPLSFESSLPILAVPTTAGTGAEVTPFAAVWDVKASRKLSLSHPRLTPSIALLDPLLTVGLPEAETISTGLDALSQAFESYWGKASNTFTESWALQTLRLVLDNLPLALKNPGDVEVRARLLEAGLLSGLAISHTRTGIAHSISYPLTAAFGLPHGLACSFTLPAIMEFNSEMFHPRGDRLATVLAIANAEGVASALLKLFQTVGLSKRFQDYITDFEDVYALIPEMITLGRADNNLRPVDYQDVRCILDRSRHLLCL